MRIWCVIFVSVGALSGLLPRLADGVCSDAVKYVSKEELGSAIIINRCDQFGNICSKEEQIICTAQWRRIDGSSNRSAYIDPNNRTHYQFLTSQSFQGEVHIQHTYEYVCGLPTMCHDSNATHWQTARHLTLIIPGISLVVVSGDGELTEGETVEMECAAGVLDANSILVLFRFNERVMAYCRPFQSVPKVYHKSWTIYRRNDSSSNCVLRIAAVKASDSGQYTCEGFLPADHLAFTSNTITMTVMEDPSNTGIIVGPSVAVAIVLVACIVLIVLVAVCKRQNKIMKQKMLKTLEHSGGGGGLESITNGSNTATDRHEGTTTKLTEKSIESSPGDGDRMHLASTAFKSTDPREISSTNSYPPTKNVQAILQEKGKAPQLMNSKTEPV